MAELKDFIIKIDTRQINRATRAIKRMTKAMEKTAKAAKRCEETAVRLKEVIPAELLLIEGEKEAPEMLKKQMNVPLYECDPDKNTICAKRFCFIYGGECHQTSNKEVAHEHRENDK